MSDPVLPPRPPTDAERYASALRRVMVLKERHPELHEAVIQIIGKRKGECFEAFFDREFNPTEAAKVHTRFKDLDEVQRVLLNPAAFISEQPAKPVAKAGGGPLPPLSAILRLGRRMSEAVRKKSQPVEGGK